MCCVLDRESVCGPVQTRADPCGPMRSCASSQFMRTWVHLVHSVHWVYLVHLDLVHLVHLVHRVHSVESSRGIVRTRADPCGPVLRVKLCRPVWTPADPGALGAPSALCAPGALHAAGALRAPGALGAPGTLGAPGALCRVKSCGPVQNMWSKNWMGQNGSNPPSPLVATHWTLLYWT